MKPVRAGRVRSLHAIREQARCHCRDATGCALQVHVGSAVV